MLLIPKNRSKEFGIATYVALIAVILYIGNLEPSFSEVKFEEVTRSSGISYNGTSWGSSWGDFNGDAWPDLFVSNHGNIPSLYVNNKNGTFTNFAFELELDQFEGKDTHGASWADYNNDGKQDLIVLVGAKRGFGNNSNLFLVNEDEKLVERSEYFGIDYSLGRGRTPIWLDYNDDGLLDLLLNNSPRPDNKAPTSLFQNNLESFNDVSHLAGLEFTNHVFVAHLADLSKDGAMDLIFTIPSPQGIFQFDQIPFKDIQKDLGFPYIWAKDIATGDYNGDLTTDVFLVRSNSDKSIVDFTDKKIIAQLVGNEMAGFYFKGDDDDDDFEIQIYQFVPKEFPLFVGTEKNQIFETTFYLNSKNSEMWGFPNLEETDDSGIYLGYDPETNIWKILKFSRHNTSTNIAIKTDKEILTLGHIYTNPKDLYQDDKLYFNFDSGFRDVTEMSGIKNPSMCSSVVTGDFDNDTDLDLYLVCGTPVKNLPNIMYENLGNGKFSQLFGIGTNGSSSGIGDSATTVDYDNDGFLDIFLTNGKGWAPFSDDGPNQLFRNLGNDNNWIEIDLKGTISNRDGIGASVFVYSEKTIQQREQNGGMHNRAQNFQRLHFGLGEENMVEKLIVTWPNGFISGLKNISANQILELTQPNKSISPKMQTSLGIKPLQLICNKDLVLILKISGEPSCVKSSSKKLLIDRGWGKSISIN